MTALIQKRKAELWENDWFSRCGEPLGSPDVAQFNGTWRDLGKMCKKNSYASVRIECRNILTEQLSRMARERYRDWLTIGLQYIAYGQELLREKVLKNGRSLELTEDMQGCVTGDVVHCFMELEYADLVPPKYFAEKVDWYLRGHFPCGWDGKFPAGQLIVF